MEKFKQIEGFDTYEVSSYGRVRRTKNGRSFILKPWTTDGGYLRVELGNRLSRPRVHRLVAENFIENVQGLPIVNHIDGNKTNNDVNNLEWVSASYNQLHNVHTLNNNAAILTGGKLAKRPIDMFTLTGKYLRSFDSVDDATEYIGVWIKGNLSGRNKSAGGYVWKYAIGNRQ